MLAHGPRKRGVWQGLLKADWSIERPIGCSQKDGKAKMLWLAAKIMGRAYNNLCYPSNFYHWWFWQKWWHAIKQGEWKCCGILRCSADPFTALSAQFRVSIKTNHGQSAWIWREFFVAKSWLSFSSPHLAAMTLPPIPYGLKITRFQNDPETKIFS